jgi:hypothetical protein
MIVASGVLDISCVGASILIASCEMEKEPRGASSFHLYFVFDLAAVFSDCR